MEQPYPPALPHHTVSISDTTCHRKSGEGQRVGPEGRAGDVRVLLPGRGYGVVPGNPIRYIRCGNAGLRISRRQTCRRGLGCGAHKYGVRTAGAGVWYLWKSLNWRTVAVAFVVATVVYAVRTRQPAGTFLKVPYDFRMPTLQRLRDRVWNPEDSRIFTPRFFGIGWSVNVYQLMRRVRGYQGGGSEARRLQGPER